MTRKRKSKKLPIYSVVDLETTGTSVKNGDRIIQVGLVMVQGGKIINQFETRVNPMMRIPHSIEQLTGIQNRDVATAPLFEEVAPTLESLLSGTIFVAHNVNFDFPFLNSELERVGRDPLSITAIDTVTLAQILLPTSKSFRLRDLTNYLHIEHDHPHSAVSDAEATAHLLNVLLKKLHQSPDLTLQKIIDLHLRLPFQTAEVFAKEMQNRQKRQPLPNNLYISHGVVLHKTRPVHENKKDHKYSFPRTKRQKEKMFEDHLAYRPLQAKMMNTIYNYFSHDGVNQVVLEAGTGVGKTLGYLVPLGFLAYPRQKIVVSTATNVLQKQLVRRPMEQLNSVLPFKMTAVVVKGNSHYLNLSKFVHSLSVNEDSQLVQILKARVLVWLLHTVSGDLDELNLNSQQSTFFTEIAHHGLKSLSKDDDFYNDDFLVRRQRDLEFANIVITNHAFLVSHAQDLGGLSPLTYLVVDEAQHLGRSVLKRSRGQVSFQKIAYTINQLASLVNADADHNLLSVFANLPLGTYNIDLMQEDLSKLSDTLEEFQQVLYEQFSTTNVSGDNSGEFVEQVIDNDDLAELLSPHNELMERFEQLLGGLQIHFSALRHLFINRQDSWLTSDRYIMNQFASQMAVLANLDNQFHDIERILNQDRESAVYWLTIRQSNERSTMRLSGGLLVTNHYLRENVYAYFYRQLFVGATLYPSQRSRYLYKQLDLDPNKVRSKRLPVAFDFENRARLLIANDAPLPDQEANGKYIDYLSNTIYRIAMANQCQILILFNSLITIEQVYGRLHRTDLFNQRDILAQGINGNREKLLKQFATGTNSVLLGAASFWEGIDLPEDKLQLLIITKLPFDAPNEVYNKAEHNLLKKQGKSPFYQSELPRAIIRLRQGVGRLLRTPRDYGVAVVLDSRIITKKYGKTILNALPKQLNVKKLQSTQLATATKKFLKKFEDRTDNK